MRRLTLTGMSWNTHQPCKQCFRLRTEQCPVMKGVTHGFTEGLKEVQASSWRRSGKSAWRPQRRSWSWLTTTRSELTCLHLAACLSAKTNSRVRFWYAAMSIILHKWRRNVAKNGIVAYENSRPSRIPERQLLTQHDDIKFTWRLRIKPLKLPKTESRQKHY